MIYLLGGNRFDKILKEELKHLDGGNICFVPTSPENIEKSEYYINLTLSKMKKMGINFSEVFTIRSDDTKDTAKDKFNDSNCIYLMGGDTESLLMIMRKLEMKDILENYDGTILGLSAGALALCKNCVLTKDEHNSEDRIIDGISIIEDLVFEVHYDGSSELLLKQLLCKYDMDMMYGIGNSGAIKTDLRKHVLIGDVKLIKR